MICVFDIKDNRRKGEFLGMYGTKLRSGLFILNVSETDAGKLCNILSKRGCHGTTVKFWKQSKEPENGVF